jgi:hypothetical protein
MQFSIFNRWRLTINRAKYICTEVNPDDAIATKAPGHKEKIYKIL